MSAARRAPATITVEKASRWYGDVLALDAVQLTIGPGVTGLLGPNGAGKSTLIRLITGMASAGSGVSRGRDDAGRVLLDGVPVRNHLPSLARIGFVPDGDGLYEDLPARRFLVDQAQLRGFVGAEAGRRAAECLQHVGLADAADRRTGGFSKGMRQRLKLAQALLHDPDVLVLDEPLTGLDPVMRRDFIRIVRELGDEGVTVLVSSHVLHEVEAMTDSIVLLHHGQVLAEGTVPDIRDLLEKHARRIRLGTPDPRGLARRLLEQENLLTALTLQPQALIVETMQPDTLCRVLQRFVTTAAAGAAATSPGAGERLELHSIEPLDDDLGSVFAYLVNR
ncbi:MAG: ABC transporter ATP-binding protein [Planctomycetota bacterium]